MFVFKILAIVLICTKNFWIANNYVSIIPNLSRNSGHFFHQWRPWNWGGHPFLVISEKVCFIKELCPHIITVAVGCRGWSCLGLNKIQKVRRKRNINLICICQYYFAEDKGQVQKKWHLSYYSWRPPPFHLYYMFHDIWGRKNFPLFGSKFTPTPHFWRVKKLLEWQMSKKKKFEPVLNQTTRNLIYDHMSESINLIKAKYPK